MTQITDQTKWCRVLNHVAADLRALVSIASGEKITVEQATANSLKALVTLAPLQGIIPNPINATRVNVGQIALGSATMTIYTVPSGKLFFLTNAILHSRESANAAGEADVIVYNQSAVLQYHIQRQLYDVAGHQALALQFIPALELPANWYVIVTNNHANIDSAAFITGWLEDV